MSCERLRPLLETYLDGELPTEQTLELQAHVDSCGGCAESMAFSRAIRASARHLVRKDALVSDDFRARLETALAREARVERDERRVARFRRRVLRAAPRVAMGGLAV